LDELVSLGDLAADLKPALESGEDEKESTDSENLSDESETTDAGPTKPTRPNSRPSRVKPPKQRSAVIPTTCVLVIRTAPRINAVYHELRRLDVEQYTNACAVTLRVFVELSVDHHIMALGLMTEEVRRNSPLAKRLKELAASLKASSDIPHQLEKAIIKIADGAGMFSASTTTFNQYVHNQFAYPNPSELRTAWDELQPFMQVLWKN